MQTRIIFIDSEGTLRDSSKVINQDTLEIIKKLEEKGIPVVITTGLPRFISKKIRDESGASRYLISSNGADIFDVVKNDSISKTFIEKEIVREIYANLNQEYNIILGVGDFEYSNNLNEYNKFARSIEDINSIKEGIYQIHISQKVPVIDLKNNLEEIKDFIKKYDFYKLRLLLGEEFFEKIISSKISNLTKDELNVLIRAIRFFKLVSVKNKIFNMYKDNIILANQSLDFTKFEFTGETPWFSLNEIGVSKGNAIEILCNYLNIDNKFSIGIGNDYNDKSMINHVSLFICPSDSRSFIKEDENVVCSNLEGVSKILKRIYER